ncbi:hypothetical protein Y032_0012g1625 [Ancylostoma ceylanicum]|nr:hypothetical protein Y032_0012g1625 [Ancylostoma ceylanicum]
MLLPASAASANTAARLSLRSSFIASLHRLASSDVSFSAPSCTVACGSRCSTLAYQLEGLMRQSSLGGSQTLGFLRTITEMLNEPFVFFIDVVDNGIFPKAG